MAIAKVIEVIAEGDSIEGAIESGVKEASKSIQGIKSVYAENIQAVVEDGKVVKYRVNAKMTFVVNS
jgi:flavin-binding protein dodecin